MKMADMFSAEELLRKAIDFIDSLYSFLRDSTRSIEDKKDLIMGTLVILLGDKIPHPQTSIIFRFIKNK